MSGYKVEKCICHNKSFEEVKKYAAKHDIKCIDKLQKRRFCSGGCQRCAPYVELVLKTGKTSFKPADF